MRQLDCINRLVNKFTKLPGVGGKTALRYAYAVVNMQQADVDDFCDALASVKTEVKLCSVCGNYTDKEVCDVCAKRDGSTVCVVAYPKDVLALEKSNAYNGVYHVLFGTLSPMNGRNPDDLNIKSLIKRLDSSVKEVIIATNPDVEGEATAMYLARLIKPLGVRVTRIAQGVSMGSDIEYADEATLSRAIETRTEIG